MRNTTIDDHFPVEILQELAFYDSINVSDNPTIISQIEHLKTLINMVEGEPEARPVGVIGEMIRTIVNQHNTIIQLEEEIAELNQEQKESNRVIRAMENDIGAFNLFDPDTGHGMRVRYDR